mmetsp:Transcript_29717/g.81179  ORF Transcript_29717/g.81179 Transcript_29717/m.81179 type:complete len:259 (+) Transcript_29717:1091-1867(+)
MTNRRDSSGDSAACIRTGAHLVCKYAVESIIRLHGTEGWLSPSPSCLGTPRRSDPTARARPAAYRTSSSKSLSAPPHVPFSFPTRIADASASAPDSRAPRRNAVGLGPGPSHRREPTAPLSGWQPGVLVIALRRIDAVWDTAGTEGTECRRYQVVRFQIEAERGSRCSTSSAKGALYRWKKTRSVPAAASRVEFEWTTRAGALGRARLSDSTLWTTRMMTSVWFKVVSNARAMLSAKFVGHASACTRIPRRESAYLAT